MHGAVERLGGAANIPVVFSYYASIHQRRHSPTEAIASNCVPDTIAMPDYFKRIDVPTPFAIYVDSGNMVRQCGRVDTLLGLAHFAEGCPDGAIRDWVWSQREWRAISGEVRGRGEGAHSKGDEGVNVRSEIGDRLARHDQQMSASQLDGVEPV